jgi:hypothetical protein
MERTKQWVITAQDGQPIAIAVIFEKWGNEPCPNREHRSCGNTRSASLG